MTVQRAKPGMQLDGQGADIAAEIAVGDHPQAAVSLVRRARVRHQMQLFRAQIATLDPTNATEKRLAQRAGQRLDLTAKEFALLEMLLRRQGEVLPKSLIASQVWDMNFDSDTNVVDVAVRRLRAKIDDPFQLKLIHSVRGIGYRFDTQP